jgi:DsbC/DsbD-like thiol-disulfide interchange protein
MNPNRKLTPWILLAFVVAFAPALLGRCFAMQADGQKKEVPPEERLKASAVFDPAEAKRGGTVTLKVTLTPAPGYHTYPTKQADAKADAFVTTIEFPGIKDLKPAKEWKEPKPKIMDEKELMAKVGIYEEKAVLENQLTVSKDAAAGAKKIKVKIDTQVCDDKGCIPFSKTLEVPLTIAAK